MSSIHHHQASTLQTKNLEISNLGLLTSLQHADSFFPSGAMAFSWGLESLSRDHVVINAESVTHFIETQILYRWISFDQGILSAAWQAVPVYRTELVSEDHTLESNEVMHAIIEIDQFADAMTLPSSIREGSRRLGLTLINVHAKLGAVSALRLQAHIANTGYVIPHLTVAQGYLWSYLGMSELEARAVSAHTVCTSATSAAVRLGLIGHLDAQRILMRLQGVIAIALTQPAPPLWSLANSTLASDIAALRHSTHDARLFAN